MEVAIAASNTDFSQHYCVYYIFYVVQTITEKVGFAFKHCLVALIHSLIKKWFVCPHTSMLDLWTIF